MSVRAVLALTVTMACLIGTASGASTPTGYLRSAQNADGGFGPAPGVASSSLYSGWAALGLAAEGINPETVRHGGQSLSAYIAGQASAGTDPGSLERTILALRASGLDAGAQLSQLQRDIKRNGSVSDQVNLTSFAVLALRAAGVAPPANTLAWITRQQDSDGGFNYGTRGGPSDIDDTGAALEALAGSGSAAVPGAIRFIERHENHDGGFPSQPPGPSNAQSTAWAVQGLIASGMAGAATQPLAYLRSLIAADGHVRYSSTSDETPVWVTAEALMALAAKPLPLAPVGLPRPHRHLAAASHHPTAARAEPRGSAHEARRRAPNASSPALGHLVADVGLLCAVALAPVG